MLSVNSARLRRRCPASQAVAAAEEIGDAEVVIKSQILAGTRHTAACPPHTRSPARMAAPSSPVSQVDEDWERFGRVGGTRPAPHRTPPLLAWRAPSFCKARARPSLPLPPSPHLREPLLCRRSTPPRVPGGVHVIKKDQVKEYADQMLGGTLVTKQSGPEGHAAPAAAPAATPAATLALLRCLARCPAPARSS